MSKASEWAHAAWTHAPILPTAPGLRARSHSTVLDAETAHAFAVWILDTVVDPPVQSQAAR